MQVETCEAAHTRPLMQASWLSLNRSIATTKSRTMLEDIILEDEVFEGEPELILTVAEAPSRDIAEQLADLHTLKGVGFITMLKEITQQRAFTPLEGDSNIYIIDGMQGDDYDNLLNAARKAVEHGYKVFILPNPKGIRTADFIFERKGVYRLYDLKTIKGKASVDNRLKESIGQSNRILLNMAVDYNPRHLAMAIKRYFEQNQSALEVLIFKGSKIMSIIREDTESYVFIKNFMMKY